MRRQYSILTLTCILILTVTACSRRKSVAITPTPGSATDPYKSGSPDDLSDYIRTVLKISQKNTEANDEALKQLHKNKPELGALSRLIIEYPDDVHIRRLLAAAYLDDGFYLNAFQLYQEIKAMAPDDAEVELALARIWSEWGDYPIATRHIERAGALDPKSARGKELMGRIHLRRNELDNAIHAFLDALKIEPDNPVLLANAGYVYSLREDWERARGYLKRAVDRDGSLVEARNNLGIALAHLGDRKGALQQFTATSDQATALNNLGVVYLEQKRYKEARDVFKEALAINPDYLKARANLREAESYLPAPAVINVSVAGDEKNTSAEEIKPKLIEPMREQPLTGGRSGEATRISIAYRDALSRFNERRFQEAMDILSWLLYRYPNQELASNCQYWIGECYFGLERYEEALAAFNLVMNYKDSPKLQDAQVMIRQASLRIQKEKARTPNKR